MNSPYFNLETVIARFLLKYNIFLILVNILFGRRRFYVARSALSPVRRANFFMRRNYLIYKIIGFKRHKKGIFSLPITQNNQ